MIDPIIEKLLIAMRDGIDGILKEGVLKDQNGHPIDEVIYQKTVTMGHTAMFCSNSGNEKMSANTLPSYLIRVSVGSNKLLKIIETDIMIAAERRKSFEVREDAARLIEYYESEESGVSLDWSKLDHLIGNLKKAVERQKDVSSIL